MIRNKKNSYERNIANNRNINPKLYYSYVNSKKKNKSHFGPLKNKAGEFVVDPKIQAETVNEFYASVFTRSIGESPAKSAFNGNLSLSNIDASKGRD